MQSKLTVVLTALDETLSLRDTIEELCEGLNGIEYRIVIATSNRATKDCLDVAIEIAKLNDRVNVYFQKMPFVAAAILEVAEQTNSSYIAFMSSDGETPAEALPRMLKLIESENYDVVTASRWLRESQFIDYGFFKKLISYCAQKSAKLIYFSQLTEFTFGYRIYKTEFFNQCRFYEPKHPFFLESILVPLRLGARVGEVTVTWQPRSEGESVASAAIIFTYIRPMLRVRFTRIQKLKK